MSPRRALLAGLAAFRDRPIRLVALFAAGGATHLGARVLTEAISAHLPPPITIENRVGGRGMPRLRPPHPVQSWPGAARSGMLAMS